MPATRSEKSPGAKAPTRSLFLSLVSISFVLLLPTILVPTAEAQTGCCTVRGNIDCSPDNIVDISDLIRFVDFQFGSGDPLCCPEAANCDGDPDGIIDISDLIRMVDYTFGNGVSLVPCGPSGLTDGARAALFGAVDSVLNTATGPDDSVAIALVDFLNSRPEIDTAAVIDSVSVWAWFSDGRYLVIPNNRPPDGPGLAPGEVPVYSIDTVIPAGFTIPPRRFPNWDGVSPLPQAAASPAAADYELPQSVQATLISTLGYPCFEKSIPLIKPLLDSNGYSTVISTGSVPDLLNEHGSGIFYMDAHGGPGFDAYDQLFLAIWTATHYSAHNDTLFESLLNNHELVYMIAEDNWPDSTGCFRQCRYAYTGKFVAQYMTFAPQSLIFMNTCDGDSVPSLRNGFKAAGASTFCGWTKSVRVYPSNSTAEYFFDRLLGSNASIYWPHEYPEQRPFDADRVWQSLKDIGLDTDPTNQSKFMVEHLQGGFGVLAPSIRNMFVIEHTDSLFIIGMFGSDPGSHGKVVVDSVELPIRRWQPEIITALIPNSGRGSAGPVTVEVEGLQGPTPAIKRKSNAVNLTEWRGELNYVENEAGTLTGAITVDFHLRADVHHYRDLPSGPLEFYSLINTVADDSYGQAAASGEYSYTNPGDPPNTDTWTWSGSSVVHGVWDSSATNVFVMTGQFIDSTSKLNVMFQAAAFTGLFETLVNSEYGTVYTIPFTLGTPMELYDAYPSFFLNVDSVWNILAGARDTSTCCSHDPENDGSTNDIHHRLSWSKIDAHFPPDPDAAQ